MSTGHKVLESQWLAPNVRRLVVRAPHVTRHCGPGQFVIIRACDDAERIPLTIAGSNRQSGTIVLIIQAVGVSTRQICSLEAGDEIRDVVGPLGRMTELENFGHAVVVGGGVGTAVIYPQAVALKQLGNRVTAVIGGRTREFVILEKELSEVCDAVYPCTDDGSYGFKGFVTDRLKQLIDEEKGSDPVSRNGPQGAEHKRGLTSFPAAPLPVKAVFAAGPVPMMRAIADLTRPYGIHTVASLNPIMVDGTGMCGGCRVNVAGQTKFACVDGPEFDAHQVDFRELSDRLTAYRPQEQAAQERHACQAVPQASPAEGN